MFTPKLLSVPFQLQQNDGECLAACSAMALGYLGVKTHYRSLLRTLDIQDFGAPFYNLRRLETLGFSVHLRQDGTLNDLDRQLQQNHPCLVAVQTSELPYWGGEAVYHALVVIGIDTNHLYLHDPAFENSPLRVTHGDFVLAWLERDSTYAVITKR